MPPIDPFELLKCLGVLLTPRGGIKSPNEVDRISRLMLRFSKKLVSKCIYIQILKATQPDLLQLFLNHEGCLLLDAWLSDAVKTNNKALLTEMLQLLEVCPLQDEKFKQTSIASMIQTVAQGNFDPGLRNAAAQLWSRFFCGKPESFATHETGLPEDIDLSIYAPETMTSSGDLFNHVVDVPMAETTGLANVNYPQYNQIYSNTVPEPAVSLASSRNLLNSTSSLVHNSQGPIINDTAVQNSVESAVPQMWGTAEPTESTDARLNSEEVPKPVAKGATSPGSGGLPRIKIVTKGGVPYVVKKEPGDENKQESEKVVAKDETEAVEKDKVKSKEKDKEKERERDKKKDKSKEKDREKDRKSSSSSHSKSKDPKSRSDKERKEKESSKSKEKEKTKEKKKSSKDDDKEKKAKHEASKQAEKDRETLAAIKAMASGGGVAKLSKIPRKKSDEKDKEKEKEKTPAVESAQPLDLLDKLQRPKTVKTFNSKFRSTGLEDGQGTKPPAAVKKPPATQATSPAAEKKQKRPSLSDPAASPSEKKPKIAGEKDDTAISAVVAAVMKKTAADTKPAVKLIPPRPRPVLQDSSLFMDALEAGSKLEPRKRKRRASTSKDTPTTPDQLKTEGENAPVPVPTSPVITKPTFKFYQDTLETEEDTKPKEEMEVDEKKEEAEKVKEEVKEEVEEKEEEKDADESGAKREGDEEKEGGDETKTTEGVLVTHVRKRPKKTVRWKSDDELHSYHFFELDENERVNVNKLKFDDMMHAERQNERQAFQIAKSYVDEEVEERPWILYVIDLPPALIVPGAQSRERDIQEARENSTLQALYFKGQILPDYPAEPDPEVPLERTTDPQIMPLDDITGNPESVYDHRHIPWPEPRVPGQYVAPPVSHYPPEPMYQPDYMGPQRQRGYPDDGGPPYYDMGPPAGGPSSRGGGGAWMTSDGSVLPETDNGRYSMGGPSRPGAYDTMGPAGGFRGPGRGFGMEGPRPRFPGAPPRGPPRSQGPRGAGPQPCWHFMRGFCRLENRCKFLHPNFSGPMA